MIEYFKELDKQLYYLSNYDVGSDDWYDTIELIKHYLNVINYLVIKEKEYDIERKIRSIYSLLNDDKLIEKAHGIQELEKEIKKWIERF